MSLENVFRLSLIVSMIDEITGPASRMSDSVNENIGRLDQWEQKFSKLNQTGLKTAGIGLAITAATMSLANSTDETSKALGELSSLGVEDLQTLGSAATDFSNQWAGTTKAEFITAAYDIKSGIASLSDAGVADYTELAGMTAKATKATTAEMTDLFATGYGIYKDYYSGLSDLEFAEIFGAGIAKSVQAFKTDGAKMSEAISTLGASATTSNVPLEEQLSILGMLQATMSGSEAGTKYKAFLQSAAKAGDTLGISFLDANNQLLGMPEILGKLQGKFGDTMDATEKMNLKEAFGSDEAVALIDLLYNKSGDLQGNIETLYSSMGEGSGLIKEMADSINSTDPDQMEVLSQKTQNLKEDLGTLLLPFRSNLVGVGSTVVATLSEWVQNHKGLATAILTGVTAFGILLIGLGIGMVIIGSLGVVIISLIKVCTGLTKGVRLLGRVLLKLGPFARAAGSALRIMGLRALTATKSAARGMAIMAKQAITTAVRAIPALVSSVWAFTAALLANPITWIVIGIIALIAVIVVLYKHWDSVTAFMKGAWQSFCGGVTAGVSFISKGFTAVTTYITGKLEWFRTAGSKIITTLTQGIKSVASHPVEAVKGIFKKLRKLLPFSDAKEGPLSELTLSGKRVLTTMVSGMKQVENQPAEQAGKSFAKITDTRNREIKKVNLNESTVNNNLSSSNKDSGKKTIIQKVVLNVDISKIKDLELLKKLIEDLEDLDNSSDDPDNTVFA